MESHVGKAKGAMTEVTHIDFDVNMGNRCKLQNGVSVYHGAVLEDEVCPGPADLEAIAAEVNAHCLDIA